ncbi:HD domain-containing phosphohydrolase [Desulfolutivibrio sp.]|uniref:HD domain-containing phosphohydrolase n=1 Tax=Desulfolutivibrio sp. TaxID=2773296 RepID=UPI002F96DB98
MDVSLSQLGAMLARQRVTPHGTLWIVDAASRLVAVPGQAWEGLIDDRLQLPLASDVTDPVVRTATLAAVSAGEGSRAPRVADIDGTPYLATLTPMADEHGLHFRVIVAAPLEDVTGHITDMALRIVLLAAVILGLAVPLAMHLARRVARPVRLLCEEAGKIQRFDFSASPAIRSHVSEMQALATACEVMKSTIRARTESLLDTQATLEKLVAGGMALSAEKDMARLVTLIFQTAKELAGADGGVLYLMEGEELEVELVSLHAESLVLGGLSENPAPRVKVRPEIMPFLQSHSVLRHACEALRTRKAATARDEGLSLFPTGLPEEPKDYRIASLITVPLATRREEVIGVIQLFNPQILPSDEAGDGISGQGMGFIGSLAAQAAVALDNHHLVLSLRDLFDALIQVIASSIDAKSPYTAGHCTRVPILTEMLAQAVHEATDGPLAGFRIETDDEWRQLWIAAWLHDCGKVTTPEYVVDKATKLETIYNRIHEIRMRFEVLRRDVEISHLRKCGLGQAAPQGLGQEFEEEIRRLHADFEFVAACNVGGEFLSDEDRKRLEHIASRQWLRYYNDRIGLSEEELGRKAHEAEPELPTPEPLLTDKPEHVIPRRRAYPDLVDAQGNPLLFPENEYNRGELYNLCISRGTLTPEERFKINEHMLSGLEMLKKIPFPEQLGRVTEIATGHHETLIGTGYPLKKTKDQLPVEARILAIADIFEALTAADRPYKKAKTLSEALGIMARMRNGRHIDPDIFDIFLASGVFSAYAETHLAAFQRDVTDVSPYVSQSDARNTS